MLEWATFAAAALAALGTFLGPIVAYRSVTRTAAETRRQSDVDRYISFALQPDAVTCRLGVAQLQYLLSTGDLSEAQLNAVSEAISAGLKRLQDELESDPDAVAALEGDGPGLDPAGLDPAGLDPAALDPAALDPAGLDPAALDPAALDPAVDTGSTEPRAPDTRGGAA